MIGFVADLHTTGCHDAGIVKIIPGIALFQPAGLHFTFKIHVIPVVVYIYPSGLLPIVHVVVPISVSHYPTLLVLLQNAYTLTKAKQTGTGCDGLSAVWQRFLLR